MQNKIKWIQMIIQIIQTQTQQIQQMLIVNWQQDSK